jgi:hypothetical protein
LERINAIGAGDVLANTERYDVVSVVSLLVYFQDEGDVGVNCAERRRRGIPWSLADALADVVSGGISVEAGVSVTGNTRDLQTPVFLPAPAA